jgi:WhiB family redox-sensing transcriptional regulator
MGNVNKNPLTDKQRRELVSTELLSSWGLSNRTIEWKEDAACKGQTDLFFSIRGNNKPNIEAAKAICRTCPVTYQCLKYAKDNMLAFGVWGGKTANERLKLLGLRRWPTS